MNKQIINTIKSCKSAEDLEKKASTYGYSLSEIEANNYFNLFHTEGALKEDELEHVTGGACYSKDKPYYLIVVPGFNDCLGFEYSNNPSGFDQTCDNCKYLKNGPGATYYCTRRTKDKDDFK